MVQVVLLSQTPMNGLRRALPADHREAIMTT
jgi:hypothetical protein